MTDRELLARYAATGSEEAFACIVERYSAMVHSTCMRVLDDPEAASDAAQATFLILARKIPGISGSRTLSGWLFVIARNAARDVRRASARRARHEREAAMMRTELPATVSWEEVRPGLNAAIASLPRRQRDAIVLRYLRRAPESEIAAEMSCSRGTVSKLISRGLSRLRERLGRRGVAVPAAVLAGFLAERTVEAAPAGLAAAIQAVCLGKAAATQSVLSVTEGAMKAMVWAKAKVITGVLCAVTVAGGGGLAALKGGTARASELKAFHREGQTFVTWKEDGGVKGEWYKVYASDAPISAGNLGRAKLIAKIPEDSNHFQFLRNFEDPSTHKFFKNIVKKKWYRAIQIHDDENASKQLPDDTGLFVRTTKKSGRTYYAVTVEKGGREDKSSLVALKQPVSEKVEPPGAVLLQKLGDRHYIYAIFCDYELWNPDGIEDNWEGYVHVFQIRAPKKDHKKTKEPYPVAFKLHAMAAWGGWDIPHCNPSTHVSVRMLDYHCVWWYGYSDALPQADPKAPLKGTVVNFTERRLLQVARWVRRGPANFLFKIDPARFMLSGHSMGGSGVNVAGMRNGDIFAGAGSSCGFTSWGVKPALNTWYGNVLPKWGRYEDNLKTNEGPGVYELLKMPTWLLQRPERETPYLEIVNSVADSVITFQSFPDFLKALEKAKHPYVAGWTPGAHVPTRFYAPPMKYRLMRIDESLPAFANASCNHRLDSGFRIVKGTKWTSLTKKTLSIKPGCLKWRSNSHKNGSFPDNLAGKTLYLAPSFATRKGWRIKSNTPTELTIEDGDLEAYEPELSDSSLKKWKRKNPNATKQDFKAMIDGRKKRFVICDGDLSGCWNGYFAWSNSAQNFDPKRKEDDTVDEERKWTMCIRLVSQSDFGTPVAGKKYRYEWKEDTATADVTPRRCQKFKPRPGQKIHWENWDMANPDAPRKIAEGDVAADKQGLVTVPKFLVGKKGWGNRLVLTR